MIYKRLIDTIIYMNEEQPIQIASPQIPITTAESGKKGGDTTLARYGLEHYSNLGKSAQKTIKEKYGPDYYRLIKKGVKFKK